MEKAIKLIPCNTGDATPAPSPSGSARQTEFFLERSHLLLPLFEVDMQLLLCFILACCNFSIHLQVEALAFSISSQVASFIFSRSFSSWPTSFCKAQPSVPGPLSHFLFWGPRHCWVFLWAVVFHTEELLSPAFWQPLPPGLVVAAAAALKQHCLYPASLLSCAGQSAALSPCGSVWSFCSQRLTFSTSSACVDWAFWLVHLV